MSDKKHKRGERLEQHVDKRADRGGGGDKNKYAEQNQNDNRRNHPPFFVFPDKSQQIFTHDAFAQ